MINYFLIGNLIYVLLMVLRWKEIKSDPRTTVRGFVFGYVLTVAAWPVAILLNIYYLWPRKR